LGLILKSGVAVNPERWGGSISRAIAGLQGDANSVFCNGVEILRNDYKSKGITITSQIESELNAIKNGDGARVTLWFTGFAPAVNPRVAIALVIEDGGGRDSGASGNATAAPVARDFFKAVIK
jgi:hypothetical protein